MLTNLGYHLWAKERELPTQYSLSKTVLGVVSSTWLLGSALALSRVQSLSFAERIGVSVIPVAGCLRYIGAHHLHRSSRKHARELFRRHHGTLSQTAISAQQDRDLFEAADKPCPYGAELRAAQQLRVRLDQVQIITTECAILETLAQNAQACEVALRTPFVAHHEAAEAVRGLPDALRRFEQELGKCADTIRRAKARLAWIQGERKALGLPDDPSHAKALEVPQQDIDRYMQRARTAHQTVTYDENRRLIRTARSVVIANVVRDANQTLKEAKEYLKQCDELKKEIEVLNQQAKGDKGAQLAPILLQARTRLADAIKEQSDDQLSQITNLIEEAKAVLDN